MIMASSNEPPQITFDTFLTNIRSNSRQQNIFYVSPHGDDRNDGLSWVTAKETVLGAYDSIRPSPDQEFYGVIYIAHRSKIHEDIKQGIWIMGRQDPFWQSHNYNNFPNNGDLGMSDQNGVYRFPEVGGWRKAKHVLFKGVGGERLAYSRPVAAQLGADLNAQIGITFVLNENYPAIWISGAAEIAFEDLIIRNRKVGINLGVARSGVTHINNDDAAYCIFRNVCIDVIGSSANYLSQEDNSRVTAQIIEAHPELAPQANNPNIINPLIERHIHERVGPCVHSEKGLKVRFENCVFSTTHQEQLSEDNPDLVDRYRGYSDNRACILARTPSIISIFDCVFKNGNFKYYGGTYVANNRWNAHTFAFDIRDCIFEGSFLSGGGVSPMGALVHLIQAYDGAALIENVGAGDVSAVADVKIEGSEQVAGAVVCINVALVIGPATILNIPSTQRWQNIPWTLARERQVGFWQGRVSAQHDSARRAFSPVAARFKNLVNQDASTWPTNVNDPEMMTSLPAPDGTLGAIRLSPIGPWVSTIGERKRGLLLDVNNNESTNPSKIYVNSGDVIVAGVWVRAAGEHGLAPWVFHLMEIEFDPNQHYKFANGLELLFANAPLRSDGEWEWISVVGRVKEVTMEEVTHPAGGAGKVLPVSTKLSMYLNCVNYVKEDENTHVIEFKHSHPHDFYAPILLHIPGNEISENEIYELHQHMSTWPNNVEPGTVSLLRGQDFALQSHIVSKGTEPTPVGDWDGGVDGNDVSGRIYVKEGSIIEQRSESPVKEGIIATLKFTKSFRSKPRILLTTANHYASSIPIFVDSWEKGFSIHTTMTSKKLEKYSEWNYFIIE
jgi:hypothetical protein